jgi:heme oxygenase
LKIFYGFFHPLENIIKNYITNNELADINERRQSELLEKDLQSLNITYDLKLTDELPGINNTANAFGALYVMEGSTLGGRMISKMLLKNKRVDMSHSNAFFNGYEMKLVISGSHL